jgi:hypothetical protein
MTRAVRRRPAGPLALAALLLALTGCTPASLQTGPAGIDELVVPLAEPDPDRFVAGLDHPWVAPEPRDADGPVVAGVATTEVPVPVLTGVPGLLAGPADVDLYAQDVDGNVWWFGREGVWAAGESGAQAGLVLTAEPRLGDGYQAALAPAAAVDLVSEVVEVDAVVEVAALTYDDVVVVDTRDLVTGAVERTWWAEGVGRVQTEVLVPPG